MEDEDIVALFLSRSQSAIHALSQKYGRLCLRVSQQILGNQQDAEECVNDAYLVMWNTIPPEHPKPLAAYLCKVTRNLSLTRRQSNMALKRNSTYDVALHELEDCLASSDSAEDEVTVKDLTKMIEQFLDKLHPEDRTIFLSRYWFSESYCQIAQRVGLTEKTVSVRLSRMRKKLRIYFKEEGVLK